MAWRVLSSRKDGRRGGPAAVAAAVLVTVAAVGASSAWVSRGGTTARETAAAAPAAPAGDHPAGFWYGTDSRTITMPGPAPYREPVIGGAYGGYIGMIGNWSHREGCGGIIVWSSVNSRQANT